MAQHAVKRRKINKEKAAESYRLCIKDFREPQNALEDEGRDEYWLWSFVPEELKKYKGLNVSYAEALNQYKNKGGNIFHRISRVRIDAKFPWMEETVRQTLFAFTVVEGRRERYDFVKYRDIMDGELKYGQAKVIVASAYGCMYPMHILLVREMVS